MTAPLVAVESFEEEWRTNTRRVQHPMGGRARVSFGRACLHVRLVCGHYVQRFAKLDRGGLFTAPTRARCDQCSGGRDAERERRKR
jgi:hypothetical protein